MKNKSKKIKMLKKQVQGITLIALVVTIIVLLILAGVAISLTVGDNGLFRRAQNAADTYEQASKKEKIELAIGSTFLDETGDFSITKSKLENALRGEFGNDTEISVEENGDGSFLITIDNKNEYYVGEDGELIDSSNMIKISTADELKAFKDDVNSGNTFEGKYVYLANDITLDINEEWEPIGYYSQDTESAEKVLENENNKPFSGIFDGHGHTINNMYINTSNVGQGFFGLVINGEIKNINIAENCSINTGGILGSVVGYMYNTGKISGCKNYANLDKASGGIVGSIAGSITVSDCINYGDIQNGFGGVVGSSNGTDWEEFANVHHTLINCANYGIINRTDSIDYVGGIAGYFKGNILNSFNLGNIVAKRNNVGGIVGEITGNANNCYNIADITGSGNVGGIAGCLTGSLINCYTIANITANYSVGTFYGYGTIATKENCYSKNDEFTASDLGDAFEEDTENINQGYPILKWQKK